MPKILKAALISQLLIFALIAQALAGLVLPNAPAHQTRHFSRRAIDSASTNSKSIENDRDIAAQSDQSDASEQVERSLKVNSSSRQEGGAITGDVSSESESAAAVKSTKLLPALSNNHASAASGEHKSSEKLVLNRVESQSEEVEGELMEAKAALKLASKLGKVAETSEGNDEDSTEPRNASRKDEKHQKEKEKLKATSAPGVFSQAAETLSETRTLGDAPKHIENGLDELELKAHATKAEVGLENADTKDESSATTEEILKELEEVALKFREAEHAPKEAGSGNKAENIKENNIYMGRSMDAGAQSSENKLEEYFRGKLLKEDDAADKLRGGKGTDVAEQQLTDEAGETKSKAANIEIEANETVAPKKVSKAEEVAAPKAVSKAQETSATKAVSQAQAAVAPEATKSARKEADKAVSQAQEISAQKAQAAVAPEATKEARKEEEVDEIVSQAKEISAQKAQEASGPKSVSQAQSVAESSTISQVQAVVESEAVLKAQENTKPKVQEEAASKAMSQAQAAAEPTTTSQAQAAAELEAVSQAPAIVTPATTTQAQEAARLKLNSKPSQSEKRAKFISETSTNSQNMNLPDGSVAWSLAGMRMVPKEMNNTNEQTNIDTRWQLNEIVTTERTMNVSGYSEKNLLDWTKVMGMGGELAEADMEKNHLTEGITNENDMKYEKTRLAQEKLSANDGGASQIRAGENEHKTQLTTEGIVMLKQSEQTTVSTHLMNELDTTAFTTKTTVSNDLPLTADNREDVRDNATTADGGAAPITTALPQHSAASTATPASAPSTQMGEVYERSPDATPHQLSTTQQSKVQNQPSDDFNFIVTSTTPLAALLEVTAGLATTMSTANEANVLTTTANTVRTTPTILAALPVEHSTSTTATPSDAEATKRWDNETTTEMKARFDEIATAEASKLSSEASADVGSTNVANTSKSNYGEGGVHDVTLEQHLKRAPETVIETKTETVEQNTLLTVSELQSSKAHASLSADEQRKSLNVSENVQTVEDIGDETTTATTIHNKSANVATETTTSAGTHIATTVNNFINTTDLVDKNVSEVQTVVTAKETEQPQTTTEVSQIGNEVELEVRTNEPISGAAEEGKTEEVVKRPEGGTEEVVKRPEGGTEEIVKRPSGVVEEKTEASVGPTDVETTELNNETGSSAHKVLDDVTVTAKEDEPKTTTEKTVVSINEFLIPVSTTTTLTSTSPTVPITSTSSTTPPPTQQTAVEPVFETTTTPKSDESAGEQKTPLLRTTTTTDQTSVSVDGNSATTSTTTSTPVDFLPNHATAQPKGSDDTESSSETNVIDQLDKQTTTVKKVSETHESRASGGTNINAIPDTTSKEDVGVKVGHESGQAGAQDVVTEAAATTQATTSTTSSISSTMSSGHLSTPATTTTEPPLINLLDDTTTTSTTPTSLPAHESSTATSSNGMNPQEVYTLVSTTESTSVNTSSTTTLDARPSSTTVSTTAITTVSTTVPITPEVPKQTSTTETTSSSIDTTTVSSTSTTTPAPITYIPTVASTIVTTTMLPPPTLHASIGGGGGASNAGMPTHLPDIIDAGIRPSSNDANETDVNVIIAITVSVIGVIALILLVAFLYLMRKRQKQMSYGQRCRPVSLDAYSLDNVSVLGSVRRKGALRASKRSYGNIAFDDPSLRHNTLSASELAKFVERRSSIFEEFRDVPQIIARADEIPAGCEDKNRYANVIPLPETRVVLQQLGDDDKTEYINANYVRGPKDAPNYYIATQAPLEATVTDFWRMIWEQQSRVIIQATDLYENGIEKCAEYLPPSATLDNHATYGDFQITLKNREVKDKYAISTLMLKNIAENTSRELTHYWYKWPETGVPSEEAPIIAMLLEARSSLKGYVNETREKSSSNVTLKSDTNGEVTTNGNSVTIIAVEDVSSGGNGVTNESAVNAEINGNVAAADKMKSTTLRNQGPLTIHCSPGTGRTGTIIACDMAIRSLETPKRSVDIPQIVYYVRRGRASAVQTKEQYEFIYKVAHMYATKITNLSNDN